MPRLTADLVKAAPSHINPLKEREICFRGYKIPQIENLGVTEDQYDCMDFSDNELLLLDGFPLLKRLSTLILNNNRIVRIGANLETFLPKLEALVLPGNKLAALKDIDPLATLPRLDRLVLMNNPLTKLKNYRLYIIHRLPRVKLLDYRKVKPKERTEAAQIFGPSVDAADKKKMAKLAKDKEKEKEATYGKSDASSSSAAAPAKTFTPGVDAGVAFTSTTVTTVTKTTATVSAGAVALTAAQRAKIMEKIQSASTMAEIAALESMLKTGKVPADFA